MSTNLIQTSFAAGELAPSLTAHTDLTKYKSGAAVMRNFFVDYRSGASTRPGTMFVIQALGPGPVRLIPYQLSTEVSFEIEFGDFYCRFIVDGGAVLEDGFAITNLTKALPAAATAAGNNFIVGDWVYITGAVGAVQFNNRFYKVLVAGNTFTLADVNGVPIDSLAYSTYLSGGTVSRVYKIASPYAAEDLAGLKLAQSASVMTLTHPDYPPYALTATAPTAWTFTQIVFGTTVLPPTSVAGSPSSAGTTNYAYVVTSIDSTGQQSVPSAVANVAAAVNVGATAGTITVSWAAASGAASYNVYKAGISFTGAVPVGASFGFVGSATGVSFVDSNIVPDYTTSPPIAQNPFTSNNPITFCYFQQRATYGGSLSQPTDFWMSQPGSFNNFNVSHPTQDDDAISGTIVSLQVNEISAMIPMPGGLVTLTSKGAWQISGSSGGASSNAPITPQDATATPQAYNGASDIQPIVVNYDIVYVQAKGSSVRDLAYNIQTNIYTGADISILSNHLFLNYQIREWAYAEEPFKVIWAVRSDGILLSLTFVKEQEIYGWARHDTLGQFKSVSSITEGQVDAVYVGVKRYIGGQWVQMIERFDDRMFTYSNANPQNLVNLPIPCIRGNAESAWCVDCGVQSTLPEPAAELTADTSYGAVRFTASAAVFSADDVDSVLRMGGGIATIATFVSPTILEGTWNVSPSAVLSNDPANTPLPAESGDWSLTTPFTTFYGLDYLEGQTVSILADGSVVTPQVVTNGSITLSSPATLVTVGLKYQAQLQTMYLDIGSGETVQGKRKRVTALTVRADNTRGLSAGRTFATLVPIKEFNPYVPINYAIPLVTGDERVVMDALWDDVGQICLQQDDPLPATVLGVIPEIVVGDK